MVSFLYQDILKIVAFVCIQKGGSSMYILFIVLMIVLFVVTSSGSSFAYYIDPISLVILLLVGIPVLISTGLMKDFNNAFKLGLSKKKEGTIRDVKRAIEAVALFQKVIITTGIVAFFLSAILVVIQKPEYEILLPSIAVALVAPLYASVMALILQPLEVSLKLRLQDMLHE